MAAQQLLLSWKDHNGALVSVFENLLRKKTLVDCTLAAEGQYLKAHKVVLSACSSYFELLFSQESEKNPIVILKDVKFQELVAAVNFMYRGEVEVYEDRLAAFLEVADCLQIKGLGSDGESQDSKGKVSTEKRRSEKSVLSGRQRLRNEDLNPQSDNVVQNSNESDDREHIKNFASSSVNQSSRRGSSPSVTVSTFSLESSCPVRKKSRRDLDNLQNVQQSLGFPSGESIQSEDNLIMKTEPEMDTFLEDETNATERDYEDDEKIISNEDDCDEPNTDTMDAVPTIQQNFDYPSEHTNTENTTSENFEDLEAGSRSSSKGAGCILPDDHHTFSSVLVKEEPGTSASWNKEVDIYGVSANGDTPKSSAVASAASTGLDGFVNEDNKELSPTSVQFPSPVAISGSFASGKSTDVSLPLSYPAQPSKNIVCPVCKELFFRMIDLEKHKRSKSCGTLPSVLESESQPVDPLITQSLILDKSNQKSSNCNFYKCSLCNYVTTRLNNLKYHFRIHSGDKPFICQHCDYASKRKGDLVAHLRIHTGEKPFKCPHCDYASATKGDVIKHLRIHTGEKPYKCPHCDYACRQKSNLSTHVDTHMKRFSNAFVPNS